MSPGVAAYHLARALGGEADAPEGFCRRAVEGDAGGSAQVLEHLASGIKMCDQPLRCLLGDALPGQSVLLYHYTSEAAYSHLLELYSRPYCISTDFWEVLERTAAQERAFKDLGFGRGTYMSSRDPEDFGSQEAVLVNFFTNALDPYRQRRHVQAIQHLAEFCIPVLVPRQAVKKVMVDATLEMAYGPGLNKEGKRIRFDRDLWVVLPQDLVLGDPLPDDASPAGGEFVDAVDAAGWAAADIARQEFCGSERSSPETWYTASPHSHGGSALHPDGGGGDVRHLSISVRATPPHLRPPATLGTEFPGGSADADFGPVGLPPLVPPMLTALEAPERPTPRDLNPSLDHEREVDGAWRSRTSTQADSHPSLRRGMEFEDLDDVDFNQAFADDFAHERPRLRRSYAAENLEDFPLRLDPRDAAWNRKRHQEPAPRDPSTLKGRIDRLVRDRLERVPERYDLRRRIDKGRDKWWGPFCCQARPPGRKEWQDASPKAKAPVPACCSRLPERLRGDAPVSPGGRTREECPGWFGDADGDRWPAPNGGYANADFVDSIVLP